jgi:hypothetical protein
MISLANAKKSFINFLYKLANLKKELLWLGFAILCQLGLFSNQTSSVHEIRHVLESPFLASKFHSLFT